MVRSGVLEVLRHRADVVVVEYPTFALVELPADDSTCAGADVLALLNTAPLDDLRTVVIERLGRQLVCADDKQDRPNAWAAARRLQNLEATTSVADELRARYPAVDAAADVLRQPLSVTTEPPGAAITIDFGPAERAVTAGRHLVVATLGERRRALYVDVKEDRATELHLELPPAPIDSELRDQLRALRRVTEPDAATITPLARAAGITAVWLLRGVDLEVWTLSDDGAHRTGRGPAAHPELLLATRPPPEKSGRSPWVYVIGAAAAAATIGLVILATSTGSTTQRIQVRWP